MTTSQVFAHLPLPRLQHLRRSDTSPLVLAALSLLLLAPHAQAQNLQLTFGPKALQTLTFASTPLEDVGANSGDAFHIWHMKATDLQGNTLTSAPVRLGENNNGTSWNPSTHTETYTFTWGSIATQFVQTGNTLDLIVTESNNPNSGILFDGAEIYPSPSTSPATPPASPATPSTPSPPPAPASSPPTSAPVSSPPSSPTKPRPSTPAGAAPATTPTPPSSPPPPPTASPPSSPTTTAPSPPAPPSPTLSPSASPPRALPPTPPTPTPASPPPTPAR